MRLTNTHGERMPSRKGGFRVLAVAAAGAALAGCIEIPNVTPVLVDTGSASYERVMEAAANPGRYPTFADIPPVPGDNRSPADWDRSVLAAQGTAQNLKQWAIDNPAMVGDTLGFVQEQRAALAPGGPPPTPEEIARTAAYAEQQRQATVPPPPPQ